MSRTVPFLDLAEGLTRENFDDRMAERLAELERDGLHVAFDFERRKQNANARDPYRADLSRIPQMNRAQEQRFCIALELLWQRLLKLRRTAGFSAEAIERQPDSADEACLGCTASDVEAAPGCQRCAANVIGEDLRARLQQATQEYLIARNELMERNLHLVFKLLEKYRHVGVPVDDLVQEANLSLFKAVENFDFRRGVLFKTYAGYWINQAFLNAIYNQSRTVRVPAYIQKAMKKLRHAASTMEGGLQDLATAAREAAVDPDLAATAVQGNRYTMSLNRTVDAAESTEMVDLLEAPAIETGPPAEEQDELRQHLFEAVAQLSQREQAVLQMRYGMAGQAMNTLAEVGKLLGISLERVRQIQAGALEKIRTGVKGQSLEHFA
jgi:RNA polymerase sigma factor (sigma-70 family)